MNDSQTIFIKNLNAALDASPYNKADLAKALNVSKATVSKWFGGENGISQKYLPEVTRLLGHDVPWFYTDHSLESEQESASKNLSPVQKDIAAHIDPDTPEEERRAILEYVELLKQSGKYRKL